MKLLLVDRTAEGQALLAKRIEDFEPNDLEILDIMVNLASDKNYLDRLATTDVLILGPGLGEDARILARTAKSACPDIEIIMFVTDYAYSSGAFRAAHVSRVRKVIPESASTLDLLQEIVGIHEELRAKGKARSGRVIVVTQAKGGVGTTSLCAALAELCSSNGVKSLLWDLDIETRDLSRALTASGIQSKIVTAWVNGTRELTRESLQDAVLPIGEHTSLLMPPDIMAAAMDLVGHPDGIHIAHRILDLARVSHDNIIVDTAGKMGPATGALMRAADIVLIVIDDSVLELSAVPSYLTSLVPLLRNTDSIRFLCSATKLSSSELIEQVELEYRFDEAAWKLPVLPFDAGASRWPGIGKTLYSIGQRSTRKSLEDIANQLGLITEDAVEKKTVAISKEAGRRGWFKLKSSENAYRGEDPMKAILKKASNI